MESIFNLSLSFCFETRFKPRFLVAKSKIPLCPPPFQLPDHFPSLCYKKITLLPALALNVNTGHFKPFERTTNAVDFSGEDSLQIMCADSQCEAIYFPSYRVYLSPALCATKEENRERRLFIVKTEPRQKRHGLASGALFALWHVLHYLSLLHTLVRSKSVSPHRWNCFQGRGKKKKKKEKKKEMIYSVHCIAKIKLSQEVASIVFPLTLH